MNKLFCEDLVNAAPSSTFGHRIVDGCFKRI